jgi:hypothetical protein
MLRYFAQNARILYYNGYETDDCLNSMIHGVLSLHVIVCGMTFHVAYVFHACTYNLYISMIYFVLKVLMCCAWS